MRRLPLAAMLLALALPAAAQDRPPMQPGRDVAVTYRAEGGPPGQASQAEMRLSWLNAERKMRMDLPGGIGWSVTDTATGATFMVQEAQRVVMRMPPDPSRPNPMQPPADMRFTRRGTETILGHSCTVWGFAGAEGEGEACVTADGVMLRSKGNAPGAGAGSMTATAVSFAAQDPARFRPPAGYASMDMPAMPGGGPPPRR